MPHIHFFNIEKSTVEKFYNQELSKFHTIASAAKEATHVVYHNASYIGEADFAYIKIEWMNRPTEVEEAVKILLEQFLAANGYNKSAINFSVINPSSYYVR